MSDIGHNAVNPAAEQLRLFIERKAFSGAIVNASVEVWAQDNKWGRRVNCSLRGIMLTGEGQSLGGGSAPAGADEFAGLAKAKADADDVL